MKNSADELPTQIHQILCGALSLLAFVAAWFLLWPGIAVLVAFFTCVAAIYLATPLTRFIYRRMRGDEARADATIHTKDAGCAALIFLLLIFIALPVVCGAVSTSREYSRGAKDAKDAKPTALFQR